MLFERQVSHQMDFKSGKLMQQLSKDVEKLLRYDKLHSSQKAEFIEPVAMAHANLSISEGTNLHFPREFPYFYR